MLRRHPGSAPRVSAPGPAPGRARRWIGVTLLLVAITVPAAVLAQTGLPPSAPQPPAVPAPQEPAPAPPPQQPAPAVDAAAAAPPAAVVFPTPAGALLISVKPDKVVEFESLMALYAQALAAAGDAGRHAAWKVYKAAEPAPGGTNVLFLVTIDPAASGEDYSWQAILTTIARAFPDKQREIFEQGTAVHAGPMSKLTLTPVK